VTDVTISEEDVEAVLACYRSGWLTMGPRTQRFEQEFAAATGAEHAVAVSSGTAALQLALLAVGVGPGDEIIVPALTSVAAANVVRACGATPVLCDIIGPADHNIDPGDAAARVTPRTRAIIATHWWGYPCDMGALRAICDEHGLALVEDAAHAVLAHGVGTGDVACYSLASGKQLCVGEGGMVTTGDEGRAATVRSLRSHAMTTVTWDRHRGHAESYDILDIGFNYRMDEPRAALGLSRLPRLAGDVQRRREQAHVYRAALTDLDGVTVPWTDTDVERSSHLCFGVMFASRAARDSARQGLGERGIQTTWCPAISLLTAYHSAGHLPRAEDASGRHAALPLSSSSGEAEVATVVAALRDVLELGNRAAKRRSPVSGALSSTTAPDPPPTL
jgi:dTDP-4-amino-4,6-dideoxygalactose transaminase